MTTLVEKVARAIWAAREESFEPRLRRMAPDSIDMATGAFALCLSQARAAIAAMRAPTEAMMRQYEIAFSSKERFDGAVVYGRMIDAALNEKDTDNG